jgi:hypothetical protein
LIIGSFFAADMMANWWECDMAQLIFARCLANIGVGVIRTFCRCNQELSTASLTATRARATFSPVMGQLTVSCGSRGLEYFFACFLWGGRSQEWLCHTITALDNWKIRSMTREVSPNVLSVLLGPLSISYERSGLC